MKKLYDQFIASDAGAKKKTHIKACGYALTAWDAFVQKGKGLTYRDSVVLMKHQIDGALPCYALQAVIVGEPKQEISDQYLEPITALQDMDWQPPKHIEYAYFSIYNLYRKYCEGEEIDDWLIINQSLSSTANEEKWAGIFKSILS